MNTTELTAQPSAEKESELLLRLIFTHTRNGYYPDTGLAELETLRQACKDTRGHSNGPINLFANYSHATRSCSKDENLPGGHKLQPIASEVSEVKFLYSPSINTYLRSVHDNMVENFKNVFRGVAAEENWTTEELEDGTLCVHLQNFELD